MRCSTSFTVDMPAASHCHLGVPGHASHLSKFLCRCELLLSLGAKVNASNNAGDR